MNGNETTARKFSITNPNIRKPASFWVWLALVIAYIALLTCALSIIDLNVLEIVVLMVSLVMSSFVLLSMLKSCVPRWLQKAVIADETGIYITYLNRTTKLIPWGSIRQITVRHSSGGVPGTDGSIKIKMKRRSFEIGSYFPEIDSMIDFILPLCREKDIELVDNTPPKEISDEGKVKWRSGWLFRSRDVYLRRVKVGEAGISGVTVDSKKIHIAWEEVMDVNVTDYTPDKVLIFGPSVCVLVETRRHLIPLDMGFPKGIRIADVLTDYCIRKKVKLWHCNLGWFNREKADFARWKRIGSGILGIPGRISRILVRSTG